MVLPFVKAVVGALAFFGRPQPTSVDDQRGRGVVKADSQLHSTVLAPARMSSVEKERWWPDLHSLLSSTRSTVSLDKEASADVADGSIVALAAAFPQPPKDPRARGEWVRSLKIGDVIKLFRNLGEFLKERKLEEAAKSLIQNLEKLEACGAMTLGECLDFEAKRGVHQLMDTDTRQPAVLNEGKGKAAVGLIWANRFVLTFAQMFSLTADGFSLNAAAVAAQRKWLQPAFDDSWKGRATAKLTEAGIRQGVKDEYESQFGSRQDMEVFARHVLPYAETVMGAIRDYGLDDSKIEDGDEEEEEEEGSAVGCATRMVAAAGAAVSAVAGTARVIQRYWREKTQSGRGWSSTALDAFVEVDPGGLSSEAKSFSQDWN